MSTYRKERNLIIITLDDASGDYTLDINTAILYGVKGNPIKVCPRKREIANLFPCWSTNATNLSHIICCMLDNSTKTSEYARYAKALQGADKVDALGIQGLNLYREQYEYICDNIKSLAKWFKENPNTEFRFDRFRDWCNFEKVRGSLGSLATQLTPEMYTSILNYTRRGEALTIEELSVCAYYLTKGKLWEYHKGNIHTLIDYIEKCRLMDKKPDKVNNFMKEYVETKKAYDLYRTEYDNRLMAKQYAKHEKAWEFAYGNYVVVIPKSAKEIIDEGQNMHHCVGSYANNVINGDTYICFVRHKDTPDTCYITCQVHTDGRIGQYYLAHDRHISTDEDISFKSEFAKYLREVWGD